MNKVTISTVFLVFLNLEIVLSQVNTSGFEVPATNPRSEIFQKLASTDITVSYNRPSLKGRQVFGNLVPFGEVWRTGSDASTKTSFSTPVEVNGNPLDSGKYELFTIPGKEEWMVIFQKNKSQWGSYSYDESNDMLRTQVSSKQLNEAVESFTILFENVTSSSLNLTISWDKTKVIVPIKVDLQKTVVPKLEALLESDGYKQSFRAAMFYFENDLDINRAAELMAMALEKNPNHLGMLYRQALILEKKGDIEEAIKACELSLKLAQDVPEELKKEYTKLNNELLSRLKL